MNAIKFYAPPLLWATVIFLFSSLSVAPSSQIFWQDFIIKKSAHIVEYGILATLLYRAFTNSDIPKSTSSYLAIIISILYAISDEFHQSFTPGRQPAVRDVIFDTIGASTAIYLIWKLLPKTKGKLKKLARDFQLI